MATRPKRDEELKEINKKVIEMAALIEETIRSSIKSLKEKDVELARKIIDGDEKIDDMEDEINSDCFKFLATQSPLAGDLRYCISIMKMIRDLERIGDHCEDLAKYTLRLESQEYYRSFKIPESRIGSKM